MFEERLLTSSSRLIPMAIAFFLIGTFFQSNYALEVGVNTYLARGGVLLLLIAKRIVEKRWK